MSQPIVINLPHRLGRAEAKRRLEHGTGRLKDHIPGGAAEVQSRWEGDRLHLHVRALGQDVDGHIDVDDTKVRLELIVPAFLALFASQIEGLLRNKGAELLEDRSDRQGD